MANKGLIEQELRWIDQVKRDKCSWCLECLFNNIVPLSKTCAKFITCSYLIVMTGIKKRFWSVM